MNSLLSAISGKFTQSLVLGTFFPVVLFLIVGLLTVQPLLPHGLPVIRTFQELDAQWEVVALTFVAILLSGFLYNLNIPVLRFYEGYPWKGSWIAEKWRIPLYRRQFEGASALIPTLRLLRDAWKGAVGQDERYGKLQAQLNWLGQLLSLTYPHKKALLLPTRFGNVIRSSETYPHKQYEIDSILFWPRLCQVASKDTLAAADDAKSSMDFFVNCSLLSGLLAILLFVVGAATTGPAMPPASLIRWVAEAASAALCAYIFYGSAVSRAGAWGSEVRSLFDLYRWDLLKKLGYQQTPSSRDGERAVWGALTKQFLYGDPPANIGKPLPYKDPAEPRTLLTPQPADLGVAITSGVHRGGHGARRVVHRIYNGDAAHRPAVSLRLSDNPPDGTVYVWGSARIRGAVYQPPGTSPLLFEIGPLGAGADVEVEYSVLPADLRPNVH